MSGRLDGSEALRVVRHLLGNCPACRAITSEIWRSTEDARLGKPPRDKGPSSAPSAIVDWKR